MCINGVLYIIDPVSAKGNCRPFNVLVLGMFGDSGAGNKDIFKGFKDGLFYESLLASPFWLVAGGFSTT